MKFLSKALPFALASTTLFCAFAPAVSAAGFSSLGGLFGQNMGINQVYVTDRGLVEHIADPIDKTVQNNLDGMNVFMSKIKADTYAAIVPSAAGIYADSLPVLAEGFDQKQFLGETYAAFPSGIKGISLWETMQTNRESGLFYRTDHHWTTDTAYLAYRQIVSAMGITPLEKDAFEFHQISENFSGTLNRLSGLNVAPDSIFAPSSKFITSYSSFDGINKVERSSPYFPEFLNTKDQYAYFLSENKPIVKLKSNANTGKTLMMFKDSYSHCLAPMLAAHFDEIVLIDLRYINGGLTDFVDLTAYDTALFLYNIDVFSHQYNSGKLKALLR